MPSARAHWYLPAGPDDGPFRAHVRIGIDRVNTIAHAVSKETPTTRLPRASVAEPRITSAALQPDKERQQLWEYSTASRRSSPGPHEGSAGPRQRSSLPRALRS